MYKNYPIEASANAESSLLHILSGRKCNNKIGEKTGIKLINREGLSLKFVKKIYSYLSRAKVYAGEWGTCGDISYNLWGGDAMLKWCKKTLNK